MRPVVSVLMPVYNGAAYLDSSIGCVVSQTFSNWELIVLDDGSTDDSHSILTRWAGSESRIRMFSKTNDPKGNVARNIALMCREAKGEYAFYMSQDDTMDADCLERLVARARELDADIVLPDMLLTYADGTCSTWPCSYPPEGDHTQVISPRRAFFLSVDFTIHGFGLVRLRLMTDKRNDTRYYDSDEYNSRMQFLWANRVAFAHTTFYYYQGNPDAVTRKFSMRRFQRLETALLIKDAFEKEFTDHRQRGKLMCQLMHFYIDTTLLLFVHEPQLSPDERRHVASVFRKFERQVSFKGYRREVLRHLNSYEQSFACCYFIFGTTRPFSRLYRIIHRLRKNRKG